MFIILLKEELYDLLTADYDYTLSSTGKSIYTEDEYCLNIFKLRGAHPIEHADMCSAIRKNVFGDNISKKIARTSPEGSYELLRYIKTNYNFNISKEEKLEFQSIISTSANYSYRYARDILNGRFELGESVIATDAHYSYWYARYVLEGRFELGETIIATNAEYSYRYACDVLKGRFKLGEPVIGTYSKYKDSYQKFFGVTL